MIALRVHNVFMLEKVLNCRFHICVFKLPWCRFVNISEILDLLRLRIKKIHNNNRKLFIQLPNDASFNIECLRAELDFLDGIIVNQIGQVEYFNNSKLNLYLSENFTLINNQSIKYLTEHYRIKGIFTKLDEQLLTSENIKVFRQVYGASFLGEMCACPNYFDDDTQCIYFSCNYNPKYSGNYYYEKKEIFCMGNTFYIQNSTTVETNYLNFSKNIFIETISIPLSRIVECVNDIIQKREEYGFK